jgi:hypothetical protein
MNERDQFEAHIKSAAWYLVLSEAAKDDDDGASIFRMARIAASEAWDASRRTSLDRCADILANVSAHGGDMNAAIGLIRALAGTET